MDDHWVLGLPTQLQIKWETFSQGNVVASVRAGCQGPHLAPLILLDADLDPKIINNSLSFIQHLHRNLYLGP